MAIHGFLKTFLDELNQFTTNNSYENLNIIY